MTVPMTTLLQVVVMLRKGGRAATTRGISVSADSMLGEQFIAKEEQVTFTVTDTVKFDIDVQ